MLIKFVYENRFYIIKNAHVEILLKNFVLMFLYHVHILIKNLIALISQIYEYESFILEIITHPRIFTIFIKYLYKKNNSMYYKINYLKFAIISTLFIYQNIE